MSKHTPGPWIVGSYDFLDQEVFIDAPSGDPDLGYESWEGVAMAYGCEETPSKGLEKAKANARLISAAPELLYSAQLALSIAESWIHDQLDGTSHLESAMQSLDPVRAAIRKALGEE